MARQKLTEFSTKTLLSQSLSLPYAGIQLTSSDVSSLHDGEYVVKVDQGVKKRFLSGLVKVRVTKEEIPSIISSWEEKGYSSFLVEPYVSHEETEEQYLSFSREREGIRVMYSQKGGIHIESEGNIQSFLVKGEIPPLSGIDTALLTSLLSLFDTAYLSFLEINPFVISNGYFFPLDAACEVDTTGEFFAKSYWSEADFVLPLQGVTKEEKQIKLLAEKSQASFSFTVLNPNGRIFLLMSGGGASLVIADEIAQLGEGEEIANYGEYSGNPTTEETYLYTKELLSLLLKSTAKNKRLLIGGGVANFTDIAKTFTGVIQALEEEADNLLKEGVKVFVRRGGPNQQKGLSLMEQFLKEKNLFGAVHGPDLPLSDIAKLTLQ